MTRPTLCAVCGQLGHLSTECPVVRKRSARP